MGNWPPCNSVLSVPKGRTMEDFEDSTSDFDSSLTSSDEDTSTGGYQVIQLYSHEPLSDKKRTQSPQLDQFFGRRDKDWKHRLLYCIL